MKITTVFATTALLSSAYRTFNAHENLGNAMDNFLAEMQSKVQDIQQRMTANEKLQEIDDRRREIADKEWGTVIQDPNPNPNHAGGQ